MLTQNQKTNYDEEINSLTGGILSNLREVGDMSSMLVSKEVPGNVLTWKPPQFITVLV